VELYAFWTQVQGHSLFAYHKQVLTTFTYRGVSAPEQGSSDSNWPFGWIHHRAGWEIFLLGDQMGHAGPFDYTIPRFGRYSKLKL